MLGYAFLNEQRCLNLNTYICYSDCFEHLGLDRDERGYLKVLRTLHTLLWTEHVYHLFVRHAPMGPVLIQLQIITRSFSNWLHSPCHFCLFVFDVSIWNALISFLCFKNFFFYIVWLSSDKSLLNFLWFH